MLYQYFVLHYFYSDDVTFRILQNIADNVKIGGYLIGTCFDGAKVYNLLKKQII